MRPNPATLDDLTAVRAGIDQIDGAIMALLGERLRHVDRIVALKERHGISAAAPSRRADVLAATRVRAIEAGFDPDIAQAMWEAMLDALIERQQQTLGTDGRDA